MNMREAALEYARRGWPVFPLAPGSKVPLISKSDGGNGLHDATLDRDQITRWWTEHPNANIGINTEAAGLVVIDLDEKNGVSGIESWVSLLAEAVTFEPVTYEVSTPSGGAHLYFRAPGALKVRSVPGKLGPGLDTRAAGGSIVAAGSRTKHGEYVELEEYEPIPTPIWLRDALRKRGLIYDPNRQPDPRPAIERHGTVYALKALWGQATDVRQALDGYRNWTLNKAAWRMGKLVAAGDIAADEVEEELLSAALESGLSEREARRTIASGLNPRSDRGIA